MTRELLDVAGAADALFTSERHVRRLIYERKIPYLKVGGLVRFTREDLNSWMDSNRREVVAS